AASRWPPWRSRCRPGPATTKRSLLKESGSKTVSPGGESGCIVVRSRTLLSGGHTMSLRMVNFARWLVAAVCLVLGASPVFGEVTGVDIQRREDVLGGKSFGDAGPYEKIVGRVHFAVDPDNPHNTIIADLDKAPRNAQGKVEFSSDLYIIKPKDPARGNGVVF